MIATAPSSSSGDDPPPDCPKHHAATVGDVVRERERRAPSPAVVHSARLRVVRFASRS